MPIAETTTMEARETETNSNKPASTPTSPPNDPLAATDSFSRRHLGPNPAEAAAMVRSLGFDSLDELIDATVPAAIRLGKPLNLPVAKGEHETLRELREIGKKNIVHRSFIGAGYHDSITPAVIQRNIMENPGWYTAYTPYQAEIAQGRMEALLNFQTMIVDLTGLDIANASLLDEATAAAEAMSMAWALKKHSAADTIFVSAHCHAQTIEVVRTRAEPLGIKVAVSDESAFNLNETVFAVLLQYPDTRGVIRDYEAFIAKAHTSGALAIVAADILSLTLIRPPGEFGADIAVGSTQRFGVPLGYGGPHAAYMAVRDAFKRQMPGRLVGISHDAQGNPAYRLSPADSRAAHPARQGDEQHLHRAGAPRGDVIDVCSLSRPRRLEAHRPARACAGGYARPGLERLGCKVGAEPFFDTIVGAPEAGQGGKTDPGNRRGTTGEFRNPQGWNGHHFPR